MKRKVALIGLMNNVGSSSSHHGGGYYQIMTRIVQDYCTEEEFTINPDPETWNDYDALYILEGVNYQENKFNMIGGPQPIHTTKMTALSQYKGEVICINQNINLNEFNKRIKIDHTYKDTTTIQFGKVYGDVTKKMVIGDSHALSVWKPGFGLDRTDGRTLHGFLNRANADEYYDKYKETITYFGNIDFRFHLMRQSNPEQATKDLFNRYVDFSSRLRNNTIVEPLPIENESRPLPGTGLYKGEKYFGTRSERSHLREIAIDIIRKSDQNYLSWPTEWQDEDGIKMFEYMEPRQSVHLKPKYYMFANQFIDKLK